MFSVPSDADSAEHTRPALNGRLALCCSGADTRTEVPGIVGTSPDLLLWLYGWVGLATGAVPPDLVGSGRCASPTEQSLVAGCVGCMSE